MRDVRVQGRKPLPISASLEPVNARINDVLPAWALPNSQKTGTGNLSRSFFRCSSSSSGLTLGVRTLSRSLSQIVESVSDMAKGIVRGVQRESNLREMTND